MSQQQPENLLTSPKALNTDCDQNEDRILLNTINSKRLLFKSEANTVNNLLQIHLSIHQKNKISFLIDQYNIKDIRFYIQNLIKMEFKTYFIKFQYLFFNFIQNTIFWHNHQYNYLLENREENNNQFSNTDRKNDDLSIQDKLKSININKNKQSIKLTQAQKSQKYSTSIIGLNTRMSNLSEDIGFKDLQNSQNIPSYDSEYQSGLKNKKVTLKNLKETKKSNSIFTWLSLKRRIDSLKMLLRNLELTSMIYIKSKMTCNHIIILNDKASNQQFIENKSKFFDDLVSLENLLVKLSQFFYQLFKHIPSISSTLLIVVLLKIILALQLMYQIFMIPLLISFPTNSVNIFTIVHPFLRLGFTLPFIFEIILNFNMKYFEHGEQITDKSQIVLTYLKRDFWFDIAGVIGTGLVQENTHLIALLCIFFIRFMKFKSMYNAIEEKFQLSLRYSVAFTLINLFLSISVLAHVCGCIFQWIGIILHDKGEDTWLDKTELINKPMLDRYIASLYFSFITMISVGYGDITPINNTERIFVTFMTVFSCGTFAYVVNTIGALFEQIARNQAVYRFLQLISS